MREEGVDAGDGLHRLLDVGLVGDLAVVFWDGEYARGGEGFERIVGLRTDGAEADGKSIAEVEQEHGQKCGDQDALCDG